MGWQLKAHKHLSLVFLNWRSSSEQLLSTQPSADGHPDCRSILTNKGLLTHLRTTFQKSESPEAMSGTCLGHNRDSKMLWKWTSPRRPGLTEESEVLTFYNEAGASELLSKYVRSWEDQGETELAWFLSSEAKQSQLETWCFSLCAISDEVPVELISLFKALTLY